MIVVKVVLVVVAYCVLVSAVGWVCGAADRTREHVR